MLCQHSHARRNISDLVSSVRQDITLMTRVISLNTHGDMQKNENVMDAAFVFFFFLLLGIAAYRWGVDSRDGLENLEWERRARYWTKHLRCSHE
ncbi:hypothetical protein Krac_9672 [Ktedonobacter racemifer DSM 44963]|uniref:Uncharacterized protein n=2 Tax=Ktedonobacter racemifer TaxID=363277 RepID=D6TDA5_KTERA|nr:hypothetical protein Krac_9672 [Ktedonobacter racemifer DSM 44963]